MGFGSPGVLEDFISQLWRFHASPSASKPCRGLRIRPHVPGRSGPPASPEPHSEQDPDRFRLRWRHLDCQPAAAVPRLVTGTGLLSGHTFRPTARWSLHRQLRRQSRRLRRVGRGRSAAPSDLPSGRRRGARLDSRRQAFSSAPAFQLRRPRQLYTVPVDGAFPVGSRSPGSRMVLLAGWHSHRLLALPMGTGLEALSRRPDHAHLDRQPCGLQHRQGPARQLQRPQPDVGRRHGLLPLRSQRPGYALRLRHEIASR